MQFDDYGKLISMVDRDEEPVERVRRELAENDAGREMLAKETVWKEKSKGLKKGMTIHEVVAAMGSEPTSRVNMEQEQGGCTYIDYSPDGAKDAITPGLRLPLSRLSLVFDGDGRLKEIDWQ